MTRNMYYSRYLKQVSERKINFTPALFQPYGVNRYLKEGKQ